MNTHRHNHHCAQIDKKFTAVANASPYRVAAKLDNFITWAGTSDDLREATIDQLWAPAVSAVTILATHDDNNWSNELIGGLSIHGAIILALMVNAFSAESVDDALIDAADIFRYVDNPDQAILAGIANLALVLRIHIGGWPTNH